jgi:hypothetical protein
MRTDGLTRVVDAALLLNVSQQQDFSLSGDLRSTLAIESRIPSRPGVPFEGRSIAIPVRVRVTAQVCVAPQDVQIEVGATGRRSVGGDARVEGVEPTSNVIVWVRAYDYRRYPVQRYLDDYPLHVRLDDSGSALVHDAQSDVLDMAYAPTDSEKNLYHAMLRHSWVNSTGEVRLVVYANITGVANSTCAVTLTLVSATKSFPVFTVVGAVIGAGLGVLLVCLLRILSRNRAAVKDTLKAYMKFEFRLGVEISTPSPRLPVAAAGCTRRAQAPTCGISSGILSSSFRHTRAAVGSLSGMAALGVRSEAGRCALRCGFTARR